ncbi:MAG: hypothetical protein Q7S80_01490 [bacterium]|nr:hypothetical protein [bacterium]
MNRHYRLVVVQGNDHVRVRDLGMLSDHEMGKAAERAATSCVEFEQAKERIIVQDIGTIDGNGKFIVTSQQ